MLWILLQSITPWVKVIWKFWPLRLVFRSGQNISITLKVYTVSQKSTIFINIYSKLNDLNPFTIYRNIISLHLYEDTKFQYVIMADTNWSESFELSSREQLRVTLLESRYEIHTKSARENLLNNGVIFGVNFQSYEFNTKVTVFNILSGILYLTIYSLTCVVSGTTWSQATIKMKNLLQMRSLVPFWILIYRRSAFISKFFMVLVYARRPRISWRSSGKLSLASYVQNIPPPTISNT